MFKLLKDDFLQFFNKINSKFSGKKNYELFLNHS